MAQWYTRLGDRPSCLQRWRLTMVPMTACRGSQVWTQLVGSHAGAQQSLQVQAWTGLRAGYAGADESWQVQASTGLWAAVLVPTGSWQVQAISKVIELGVDMMFSNW